MVRRKPQCAEACDRWLNEGERITYSPLGSSKFWFTERKFNYCFKSLPVVPSEILFIMAYSYIRRLGPKGVRTVPFSGFCNIKGWGFYSLKLRKALGLRYCLLFALNTISFILRLKKKYAGFSPGRWERGDIFNGKHTRDTFSDKDEIWGLPPGVERRRFKGMHMRIHCFDGLLPGRINKQTNTETLNWS